MKRTGTSVALFVMPKNKERAVNNSHINMRKSHIEVTVAQINTKRHWKFAGARMRSMATTARRGDATIMTLNEISKEQFDALVNMPGWNATHTVNDRLPRNGWGGNAVAWDNRVWEATSTGKRPVRIDYRPGTFRIGFSKPFGKTINYAVANLRHRETGKRVAVQSYHYPTVQNSANEAREKSVKSSRKFASRLIKRGFDVIVSGDGNNIFPTTEDLHMNHREGPDATLSTGKVVKTAVLKFKMTRRSDHNGLLTTLRFRLDG